MISRVKFALNAPTPQESARLFHELIFADREHTSHTFGGVLEGAAGLKRVGLLRHISQESVKLFDARELSQISDEHKRALARRVVLELNWTGIEGFSDEWFELLLCKIRFSHLCIDLVKFLIDQHDQPGGHDTGFDAFERELIRGVCAISKAYSPYYVAYVAAAQDPAITQAIGHSPPSTPDCLNHYSIIQLASDGFSYEAVPFSKYFANVLEPIFAAFDCCISNLNPLREASEHAPAMIDYLAIYRRALAEPDLSKTEEIWTEVDRKWMDTKGPIQIVHDIETGYDDILRVKAAPDISMRFLDDSFANENSRIDEVKHLLHDYFQSRTGSLALEGHFALTHTHAGIYFTPFLAGRAMLSTFTGQSLPNRQIVKSEKGAKIFFDVDVAEVKTRETIQLIQSLVYNAENTVLKTGKVSGLDLVVRFIAPHEVGHVVYNLFALEPLFTNATHVINMLEEPRAELVCSLSIKLLHKANKISDEELKQFFTQFVLTGLRALSKFHSEAVKPYVVFRIYCFKVCHTTGFLNLRTNEQGKVQLVIDDSKAFEVLEVLQAELEKILDCMDRKDVGALQNILDEDMSPMTDEIQQIVNACLSA